MRSEVDAIAFGMAVALGAVAIPAIMTAWFRTKNIRPKPPGSNAKWKKVGTLSGITIYPLKSSKGLDLEHAECTRLGLSEIKKSNLLALRDRYFIVFREDNGEMATARTYPALLLCEVSAESSSSIRIRHPDMDDLIIQIPTQGKATTRMWENEPVDCLDCGEDASLWISQVINKNRNEDSAVKLRIGCWSSSKASRNIELSQSNIVKLFKGTTNADGGAFADLTSYMLMISSSVNELNKRCAGVVISPRQFRPNFYVESDEPPFSDLKWKWVKIGQNVFRVVKGCQRCTLTTINPDTTKKLPNNEPLKTLNSIPEAKCHEPMEESPMMGIHLGFYKPGMVNLGDSVYTLL